MLEQNATSVNENFDAKKNQSEEVDSKMNTYSKNANIGMSQFHAFSKIVDEVDDDENDESKCSTQASANVPQNGGIKTDEKPCLFPQFKE